MNLCRVIPVLLLSNGRLVKTIRFKNPKYIGDPINVIKIFNEKEVDEIIVIDISATSQCKEPNYALIEQLASECFSPLTYGGGICKLDQARKLFALGIEKICIQNSAINNLSFITDLSNQFGSQSVVVSVDIKRNLFGQPRLYHAASRHLLPGTWLEYLRSFTEAGAGEILFNSVDKDGTLSGPDLSLIHEASQYIPVPLIALGGVRSLSDILDCLQAGACATAAGSFFVYYGPHRGVLISYPNYQDLLHLAANHQLT
jgi:cyclase